MADINPQRKSDWEGLTVANKKLLEGPSYYYRPGSHFIVLKNHKAITVRSSWGHVITSSEEDFTILETVDNRRRFALNACRTLKPKFRKAKRTRKSNL